MTGPMRFWFLEEEHAVASPQDWNGAGWPRLWIYNLHYHDDLAADGAETRALWHGELLSRWMAENAPGRGPGWEPYPTSLRIVNWVKWALSGAVFEDALRHSLAVQARHLGNRLEHHLLGNHLWANAKALLFAGAFFDGPEAEGWRGRGLHLLRRELGEQILPDGGHFERSPMYHAILLEDLLDLLRLANVFPGLFQGDDVARWRETAGRMLRWLRVMTHPDGGVSFFNDAAFGIAPELAALEAYAADLDVAAPALSSFGIEALPDSGYVRMTLGPAVLIADVAEIGPGYLPGHAHADTLSFELSVHGVRRVVNGGTSTYAEGPERLRQRGTASHSTVEVEGQDSSEVWSSFRVARRARPFGVAWGEEEGALWLEGSHDGYRRLPGRVTHHRRWRLSLGGLEVEDRLDGRFEAARARFPFAPGGNLPWIVEGGEGRVVRGIWHPRFGYAEENDVLEVVPASAAWRTRFPWEAP